MATTIESYATPVEDGVATGDSTLVTIVIYGSSETIDPNDGADIRIIDADDDGAIDKHEWHDATGSGGLGHNGGGPFMLFDGEPGAGFDGVLYSPTPFDTGDDLNTEIGDLDTNFTPIQPDDIDVVCFTPGTRIRTPVGYTLVENLKVGDLVVTRDHGIQPVRWIGSKTLRPIPGLYPIRIDKDAFGAGMPDKPLLVSPQHRILLRSAVAELYFGSAEVLVAAKHLLNRPEISECRKHMAVTYIHFALDQHSIVFANDLPAETLFLGNRAQDILGEEQWKELEHIFPDLAQREEHQTIAERVLRGFEHQVLAEA